jgi:hypothetical protein
MPDMFVMPFRPAYDSNGRFAPGAQAWFTLSETNTPYPVYSDEALTTQQPNPLVADGLGKFPRSYLDPGVDYRVRVYVAEATVGIDDPLTDHDYDPYVPSDMGSAGPRGPSAIVIDPVVPTTTVSPATPASASAASLGAGVYQLSLWIPQGAAGSSGALGDGVYGDITVSGSGTNLQITAGVIALADMAPLAANSIIGNNTGAGATPIALTTAQVNTMLGISGVASLAEATVAQYRAATADKVLTTDIAWSAAATVILTPGTNVAVDMSSGFNFSLAMGGAYTLSNPTNTKDGQSGMIYIVQDGTGSRTLAYGTNWKFEGGTDPILSTTPNAVDVLNYQVRSSTFIVASLAKAFG